LTTEKNINKSAEKIADMALTTGQI